MAINKETQKSVSVVLDLNIYNSLVKISKNSKRSVSAQIALYIEESIKKEQYEKH